MPPHEQGWRVLGGDLCFPFRVRLYGSSVLFSRRNRGQIRAEDELDLICTSCVFVSAFTSVLLLPYVEVDPGCSSAQGGSLEDAGSGALMMT